LVHLAECNISGNNHIVEDIRPSNCCALTHVALGQNRLESLGDEKHCPTPKHLMRPTCTLIFGTA